jgi:hypothetical protein
MASPPSQAAVTNGAGSSMYEITIAVVRVCTYVLNSSGDLIVAVAASAALKRIATLLDESHQLRVATAALMDTSTHRHVQHQDRQPDGGQRGLWEAGQLLGAAGRAQHRRHRLNNHIRDGAPPERQYANAQQLQPTVAEVNFAHPYCRPPCKFLRSSAARRLVSRGHFRTNCASSMTAEVATSQCQMA